MRSDTGFSMEYERQLGLAGTGMSMSEPHQHGIVLGGNRARTSGFGNDLKATQTRQWKFNLFCLHPPKGCCSNIAGMSVLVIANPQASLHAKDAF